MRMLDIVLLSSLNRGRKIWLFKDSEYLSEKMKKRYKAIIALKDGTNAMDEKVLVSSS